MPQGDVWGYKFLNFGSMAMKLVSNESSDDKECLVKGFKVK